MYSGGGGYYGLVVVMPPRPQTLHRSHDNLKNPYRIASIFYISELGLINCSLVTQLSFTVLYYQFLALKLYFFMEWRQMTINFVKLIRHMFYRYVKYTVISH